MFSYGVRLLPRLGFEGHHLCASDVRIASGGAGEHDDLALPARSRDGGTHALEALRIAPAQGVVDHDGHTAVVQADDGGTGEPAQYSELLSCPRAELFEIEVVPFNVRHATRRSSSSSTSNVGPNTMRPSRTMRSLKGST